ncbi:drug efflux ABC transporter ATP-binding/permease [Streptococcus pneumoniae]|nr:drug efflux ABC transporter ATP-binding/permease [Streptococcus pneumoniae]
MKDVVYSITPENKLSIDFSFKSPFRVLLTGTSGSGKTTILNLINGSLKPQKGYVNLLSHGKKSSDSIPTVDQTPYIFDTTIRENVTLFQNEYFSDDQIIEVLKKVNLYEELEKIDILNYQCGENGSNLSGGQKQKIALARAKCVIMVTHDIELASKTDRALILKDGKIFKELHRPSGEELYKILEVQSTTEE